MRRPGLAILLAAVALAAAACGQESEPQGAAGAASPSPEAAETPAELGDLESFDDQGAAAEAMGGAGVMSPQGWRALAPAPSARTEVAAAAYLDKVWAVGGLTGDGTASAEVAVYQPAFDAWEQGPSLPQAVHHSAVVAGGEGLMVLGGYTGDDFDAPTDAVWRFDPATGEWQRGPPLPQARAAGAAAWDGQRVVYAGGVGPDGLAGDVWALADGGWRRLGELSQPREHLAAASDGDGRVWLLGGRTGGLESNLATVDLVEGGRVAAIGELPTARGGVAGFFHPEAGACAVGGEAPQATFAEVECLDAAGQTRALASLGQPRHGLGAAVVGDVAYVAMGGPQPGLTVSDAVEGLSLDG